MKQFAAHEVATALKGELYGISPDTLLTGGVVTDSREVQPGDVFVARRGETADGLDYAPAAIEAGASLIIAEAVPTVDGEHLPSLHVADATVALGQLARLSVEALRETGELTVIAITGSAGKTTVKDLTGDLLAGHAETVWPPNSYNNEVGVPLTALRASETTRFLVLEMGARSIGNLSYLTSLVRPDIAVELGVGTAHSGVFGSLENTARAKAELVESLVEGGWAVLNADDHRVAAMQEVLAAGVSTLWFSREAEPEREPAVRASGIQAHASGRTSFTLHLPDAEPAPVELALLGEHHVANALAAAAVAHLCGIPARSIVTTLATSGAASRWRMELIDSPSGITVLNDAYNANPDSMRASLKTLAAMGRGDDTTGPRRTFAVLGEMLELGEDSVEAHDSIGRLVVRLNIGRTIVVGEGAKPIFQAANLEGSWGNEAAWVPSIAEARELLQAELQPGDIVLFKSSRDAGLRYLGDEIAGVSGAQ
ncbi:UDP-N-acetylmuramoyl-tripeptide--D-alanyl-D-alanine ligase [Brevibacterium daeguense]|uniref:UDP-N-acetylmuramoyl-tripeptide--D-alanyl-D-alanine ligase n=1 Tax=Brevibacterium daeguense TaxID=909936 RepID=A0ABP8EMP9_9MICO|nr:UDP-N-acetylmuramoyl-tripeptide--D-alanyl-D-alanine ligase [Brevibacterium daeguense]